MNIYIPAKKIVTARKHINEWFGTEYNMNIYRGCSHGCIYCDSQSSCYGDDTFSTVKIKEHALQIIRDDLRTKRKSGIVATGAMSDPYNPLEETQQLTRNALELLNAYEFGAAIATKSPSITRDIDILTDILYHSPVICKITITCADDALSQILEPNVAPSSARFQALQSLSQAGIFSGILMMPILPFINDTHENIEELVSRCADAGGKFIYPAFGVTQRDGQREIFLSHLEAHFPGMKQRYEKAFGTRYHCTSPRAKALWNTFVLACQKHHILYQMQDMIRAYKYKHPSNQLSLF